MSDASRGDVHRQPKTKGMKYHDRYCTSCFVCHIAEPRKSTVKITAAGSDGR